MGRKRPTPRPCGSGTDWSSEGSNPIDVREKETDHRW